MRNFQDIILISIRIYREIFKSALVYLSEIVSLDTVKATHSNDTPTNIFKSNADIFSNFVLKLALR